MIIGPAGFMHAPKQPVRTNCHTVKSGYGDTFEVEICRETGTANYDGHSLKIHHNSKGSYIVVPTNMDQVFERGFRRKFKHHNFSTQSRRIRYRFVDPIM